MRLALALTATGLFVSLAPSGFAPHALAGEPIGAAAAKANEGPPVPALRFVTSWGKKGDADGEFYSPVHVAITMQDEVVVADLNNSRIQTFDLEGKFLRKFDLPPDMPEKRQCIVGGIAVDDAGLLFVAFMMQHKLAVYQPTGELVREWGQKGAAEGEFHQPGTVLLVENNELLVTDQCNHRVQRFSREGQFLSSFGKHGGEPGEFGGPEPAGSRFAGPHFLARDSQRRLYTTEAALGRIQQLTPEGKPLSSWGNKSDDPGGFGSYQFSTLKNTFGPIGVVLDRHDRVWVTSLNDRVQVFTTGGEFLFRQGDVTGDQPGQFIHPHGMAFDRHGHLYVADSGNQRIQKFAVEEAGGGE